MSTFTEWNGPQVGGGMPRTSDLLQLIEAYRDLTTKLNSHINNTNVQNNNVHQAKDYIDAVKADILAGIPNISQFATKEYTQQFVKKEDIPEDIASKSEIDSTYAKVTLLEDFLKKSGLSEEQIIKDIQQDIAALKEWAESDTVEKPVLIASTFVQGLIKAVNQIIFTDKKFFAKIGGTDIDGVYYILGMLTDKAGTAYIRMKNTESFSAVINYAVTRTNKGALTVTTDCELHNLKFKIVSGTTEDEQKAYLAIQSSDWLTNFAETNGLGKFNNIEFYGSGINFIPVDSEGYTEPNSNCHDICNCLAGKGFSFSELASVILNTQIFRESDNPYITANDISTLDTVGTIVMWPEFDEETHLAVNFPEGYHACDGTDVLDTDNVAASFRDKFNKYPLIDYAIIKTSSTINVKSQKIDPTAQSLAEAVSALHGIKFYKNVSSLPATNKSGVPVIVQIGNKYAVYAYTEEDGWKKYTTEYNDINKTIGAVAAVIAAEHNAEVYTVYSSIAELPTTDVESGALAIIFDGVVYTVFKYNGTAWEVQA